MTTPKEAVTLAMALPLEEGVAALQRWQQEQSAALRKAAVDLVWTLYARDHHDSEHHNLPAVEAYLVRRWQRYARERGT